MRGYQKYYSKHYKVHYEWPKDKRCVAEGKQAWRVNRRLNWNYIDCRVCHKRRAEEEKDFQLFSDWLDHYEKTRVEPAKHFHFGKTKRSSLCRIPAFNEWYVTKKWDEVTCKRCLARREQWAADRRVAARRKNAGLSPIIPKRARSLRARVENLKNSAKRR